MGQVKNQMRRIAMVLALTSLQVLTSLPVDAAETWIWVRTVSTGTDWWITKGKGEVDISRNVFKAKLQDGEDPQFTRLSLEGSESGGLITARVIVHNSDEPRFEVSGRLKRFCWKEGGRETLVLTDGADVIALFRELDPSPTCSPTQQ